MNFDSDTLFNNARRAYLKRFGENADQPSNISGVEKVGGRELYVLRNSNGVLATYAIGKRGELSFVSAGTAH